MRIHAWLFVCGTVAAGLTAWACGSDGDTSVTDSGDGGASSSSGTGSSSGAASSSGGSSSGGSSSGGSSSGSSGSVGGDGGLNPPDAGPGGTTTSVNCGSTTCNPATDVCCVTQTNAGRSYGCAATTPGCTVPDAGGGGDTNVASLKCTASANCPTGQVCCIQNTTAGASSECKASCSGGEEQLCDPKAPDGGGCTQGNPCGPDGVSDFGLPKTFGICGGG